MHVILTYDISGSHVRKVLKLCRKYFNWMQNSVFEGDITEGNYNSFEYQLNVLMKAKDSVIVYKIPKEQWVDKTILGLEKGQTDTFL